MKFISLTLSMISVSCGTEVIAGVLDICVNNGCYVIAEEIRNGR